MGKKERIFLWIVGLFFGALWVWMIVSYSIPNQEKINKFCEERGLEYNCNVECALSCERVGKTYFKYEYDAGGLFSTDIENCFCVENKEVTQVY